MTNAAFRLLPAKGRTRVCLVLVVEAKKEDSPAVQGTAANDLARILHEASG